MFIKLTHYYSGEDVYIRADTIVTIRSKDDGRTLIVCDRGMYVKEEPALIIDTIESILPLNRECVLDV